jgi:hypothetical protein
MALTRRQTLRLFAGAAAASLWTPSRLLAYAAGKGVQFRIGVTVWSLKLEGKPEAVALA